MGTPKKKIKGQKELVSPKTVEKINLVEVGKEIGQNLKIEAFPHILEDVKKIVLPLVPWLDKQIFSEAKFANYAFPKKFKNRRGLCLFKSSTLDIWLEQSGVWFLRFCEILHDPDSAFQETDSIELAKIILNRSDYFLGQFLRDSGILKEFPFLTNITLYTALILVFLSKFFEAIKTLIEEKERRLCVMREWLNLLNDFAQSLDPLISQGKEISIKEYSIFSERGCHVNRFTQDYLCPEALEPFWEKLNARDPGDFRYKQHICEYMPKSLKDLLWRIDYYFEEIKKGVTEVDFLFGKDTGRLPFTDEELSVLKKVVDSVKA